MSDAKQAAVSKARTIQVVAWLTSIALIWLVSKNYVWGDFVLLAGAIWISYYYLRFTSPPEDVANPRNGILLLAVFLTTLLVTDVINRGKRVEFISNLKALCADVPDLDEKQWEKCDELLGLIESSDDQDYDDWVAGT